MKVTTCNSRGDLANQKTNYGGVDSIRQLAFKKATRKKFWQAAKRNRKI